MIIKKHRILTLTKSDQEIKKILAQGYFLHQSGNVNEALVFYNKILSLQPNHFDALNLSGTIAIVNKNYQLANTLLLKATSINPNQANAHFNRGIALQELRKFKDALISYDEAIKLKDNYYAAYCNRGQVFLKLKKIEAAISDFNKAIKEQPNFPQAYLDRGIAFLKAENYIQAISSFDRAIEINQNLEVAHYNRGICWFLLSDFNEALRSFNEAIRLRPDFADAFTSRGDTLEALGQYEDAVTNYIKAIDIRPDFAEDYYGLGLVFFKTNHPEISINYLQRAIDLDAKLNFALGIQLYVKMQLCDWSNFNFLIRKFLKKIATNQKQISAFVTLTILDDPKLQMECAENYADGLCDQNRYKLLPEIIKRPRDKKIRIGYFSADFKQHPVSYLTAELFELHNRNQFEIIAFSFSPESKDEMRKKLIKGFDDFIDVRSKNDQEIALLAREMKIDIAIDLSGHTSGARYQLFVMRVAPIQVNYLGYPGTIGSNCHDYIIADKIVIPEDKQCFYTEKVAYLPGTFMVNDSSYLPSEKCYTRTEFNLPENEFIFCCFNASYKITQTTFAGWMRILIKVPNSVLWLSSMNETAMKNLKMQASNEGVNDNRIIFAPRMPNVNDHLNRIRLADLFLDTFPYNAHTTANDALRVGLPLLTLIGETFASRVAASLLNSVGLSDLITTNQEGYEALAIELAINPDRLRNLKSKLLSNLPGSSLSNTKLFTQNIEKAYQEMYRRYQEDLPPETITI